MKGRVVFHDDEETKLWHFRMLAEKSLPADKPAQDTLIESLDSPLRTVLEIVPQKWITFDLDKLRRDQAGTLDDSERGELLSADTERFQAEIKRRGFAD
jgi:hypothetical protein